MQQLPGRRAYLAAGVKLVALLAIPLTLFRSAEAAQEVQVDTGAADATAEITALGQRLDALEKEVQRMDDERSRIRAPLVVTGPDSSEIFTVDVDSAGRGRLRIGNPAGSHIIMGMTDQGSGISLKDSAGTTRVQIAAAADSSQVFVEDSKARTFLGSATDGSTSGLVVYKGDVKQLELAIDKSGGALKTFDVAGTPIAEISAAEDTPLLLYDLAGKPFFSVGLPETGKRLLTLGDPAATHVELGITTDGTGAFVAMMDKAGMPRAIMNADEKEPPFAAYDGVNEVFAVGPKGQGGPFQMRVGDAEGASVILGLVTGAIGSFVSVQDKAGVPRAIMNADEKEPPFAAYDGVNEVFAVGPKGRGGPFQMRIGDEEAASVKLGLFAGAAGSFVSVQDKTGVPRAMIAADPKESPIALYDPQGKPVFSVGEPPGGGPLRLLVGEEDKAHAMLGLLGGEDGAHLSIFDAQGKTRAAINGEGPESFAVYNADGEPTFSVGIPEGGSSITLTVGERDKARLRTGVLTDASGAYLSLYDQANTERAHITATEKATLMNLNDTNMRADLGSDPDKTTAGSSGLYLGKDDKDFAILHFGTADGGSAWVADNQGNGVARLGARKEGSGGQVVVTGPGGGKVIAELWGAEAGGRMAIYDTSGSPRVHMEASDTGDFVVEGAGGSFAVKASDRALMQIANAGGDVVVEAFENTNGIGIVSTGPKTSGAAAMLGNMGVAASAIEGKK